MSESILVRIARGDRAAVRDCLDRHGGLVWSIARRLCPDPADAEDAVQEVFIDLWSAAPRYDPDVAAESTFVAMIARRRLIDRRRRASRRPDHSPLPETLAAPPHEGPDAVERRDEADRAARALGGLDEGQRLVLTLSIYHGLTYDEIARRTGLPPGTVKTHARRGLIRLRSRLAAPHPEPPERA
ncbi:RNA polymerase sigma factor [Paludisphaera soli]|uniref:RNA polymerase sigma factor n=1 Tax=Paludisphaera soli TaxID=2712865 RepID=UPI0013EA2DC7|nr:sigma-70 family RNA polymerase sigma factor [Paludisphaera soli]